MKQKINIRAYASSDFVVANTLAKWKKLEPNEKKLEPNEINFSQGFSKSSINRLFCIYLCPLGATLIICW